MIDCVGQFASFISLTGEERVMDIQWFAKKLPVGRKACSQWHELPCVSINKTGISFNRIASEVFSLTNGQLFLLGFADKKILLKAPSNDHEGSLAFAVRYANVRQGEKPKGHHLNLVLAYERVVKELVKKGVRLGVYSIKANPSQNLLEVDTEHPYETRQDQIADA